MINKITFIYFIAITLCPLININSQPWEYNFGTGAGVYTDLGQSTTFLPVPASGTALVAVCSGGSSIMLENPGVHSFGSETELKISAVNTNATNKFSIIDINPADSFFTIQFDIRFSGNAGKFQFFNGHPRVDNPITFTDTTTATNAEIFTGLNWELGPSGSITAYYRPSNIWQMFSGNPFSQDLNYTVAIYSNNSSFTQTYSKGGLQSVAAKKWDIFVNGSLIGNDISKPSNGIPGTINAFTFIGTADLGNANMYIDNIFYTNEIPSEPLPVELTSLLPDKFELSQNYPNPFNPTTKIELSVPYTSKVRIDVYNILGQHIRNLINEELEEGYHNVVFDASNLPAGTYIYRIISENFSQSEKMMLLK